MSLENSTTIFENNSTEKNSTLEPIIQSDQGVDTVTIVIYVCLGIVGCVGNGLVLFVFCSSKKLRTSIVNIYLINQSCIDLVASVLLMITSATTHNVSGLSTDSLRDQIFCSIWAIKIPLWSFLFSSSYNLIALNIERYISIIAPIYHKTKGKHSYVYASLVLIWLSGPTEKFFLLWFSSGIVNGKCHMLRVFPSRQIALFAGLMNHFLQFVLPLLVMVFVYGHIAIVLRRKSRAVGPIEPNNSQAVTSTQTSDANTSKMTKAKKNVIKTMLTISVFFILCWICNFGYVVSYIAGANIQLAGPLYSLTVYAVFFNSLVNPVIYSVQYVPFKKQAMKLLCRRRSVTGTSLTVATTGTDVPTFQAHR